MIILSSRSTDNLPRTSLLMRPPGVAAEVTAASVGRGRQVVRSRITRQIELHSTLKRVVNVDAQFRTSLSTYLSSPLP